jgi:hypothetical protein
MLTYLCGNRVRSQVLDQSSRDARFVCGFHIDMHSAYPSLLALCAVPGREVNWPGCIRPGSVVTPRPC